MELQEMLIELEEPVDRISSGINAIGIMAMRQAKDPYADGFHAVWNYLADADRDLRIQIADCLRADR